MTIVVLNTYLMSSSIENTIVLEPLTDDEPSEVIASLFGKDQEFAMIYISMYSASGFLKNLNSKKVNLNSKKVNNKK